MPPPGMMPPPGFPGFHMQPGMMPAPGMPPFNPMQHHNMHDQPPPPPSGMHGGMPMHMQMMGQVVMNISL